MNYNSDTPEDKRIPGPYDKEPPLFPIKSLGIGKLPLIIVNEDYMDVLSSDLLGVTKEAVELAAKAETKKNARYAVDKATQVERSNKLKHSLTIKQLSRGSSEVLSFNVIFRDFKERNLASTEVINLIRNNCQKICGESFQILSIDNLYEEDNLNLTDAQRLYFNLPLKKLKGLTIKVSAEKLYLKRFRELDQNPLIISENILSPGVTYGR